ncbi:MAG: AraC family transcriptional regulator [Pseudomonadales bacterium]
MLKALQQTVSVQEVPGGMAAILLEYVAELGVSQAAALRGTSVKAELLAEPGAAVFHDDFVTILNNCLCLTEEPALFLHYGQRVTLTALGVLGYALLCCSDLKQLLDLLSRYHLLISPNCDIRVATEGDYVAMSVHGGMLGKTIEPMDCELFFSAANACLHHLFAETQFKVKAHFTYPAPSYAAAYEDQFGDDVLFNCVENKLLVSAELLSKPLHFGNPTMLKLYQHQCDEVLAQMDQSAEYMRRVKQELLAMPGEFPAIEVVAAQLNLGVRTLRRRLAAEGTSYKSIVRQLRCELAETYLRASPLSIFEIADMLGYQDVSNFRRAFIHWKGVSPAQYRKVAPR